MLRRLYNCLSFTVVISCLFSQASFADSEAPPKSYKIVTDDGKYVFVMHPAKGGFYDGRDAALMAQYPKSG